MLYRLRTDFNQETKRFLNFSQRLFSVFSFVFIFLFNWFAH